LRGRPNRRVLFGDLLRREPARYACPPARLVRSPPVRHAELLAAVAHAQGDQEGSRSGNSVLVVDDEALRIVNACMPADALTAAGFISA
jgi:hypothetical protein